MNGRHYDIFKDILRDDFRIKEETFLNLSSSGHKCGQFHEILDIKFCPLESPVQQFVL